MHRIELYPFLFTYHRLASAEYRSPKTEYRIPITYQLIPYLAASIYSMEKKPNTPHKEQPVKTPHPSMFTRENYIWMIAGLVVIAIGVLLMSGGRSEDPNVFNKDEVYSFRRITLAPIVIVIGLVIEIYAIFRNPRN